MGLFDRLFSRRTDNTTVEQRQTMYQRLSTFLNTFGTATSSGETVGTKKALAINAVYVSGKIIGETLSTLSSKTYRKESGKRIEVPSPAHQLMGISPDPINGVTASDFWKSVAIHLVTAGISYSRIFRNNKQEPERIVLFYPWDIEALCDKDGNISYKNKQSNERYSIDDLLIFKNSSWDGIIGIDPVYNQRELLGLAIKQQKYAGSSYGNTPTGYISSEQNLKKDQIQAISEFWSEQTNANGIGGKSGTPVLGYGMKFFPSSRTPADLEYINSANLTADQIYANYRIPPPMRGEYDRATFANAEQSELVFMKHTMLPYVVSIEQEINLKLFPIKNRTSSSPLFFKFNVNTILRADFESRTKGYTTLWERGIINANEIRALEDMNPKEKDGDVFYTPLNMYPEGDERPDKKDKNEGQE